MESAGVPAGGGDARHQRPAGGLAAAVLVTAVLVACRGDDRPTPAEPLPPTATPTVTPRPTARPTPTPLPGQTDFAVLVENLPRSVHRGQELAFTISMTGRDGIGTWEKSVLNFAFFDALVADAEVVAYEGLGVGKTPYTAETLGFGYIVYGGAFSGGNRLSLTLRTTIPMTTALGFHLVGIDAEAYDQQADHRSLFQQLKFFVEVLPPGSAAPDPTSFVASSPHGNAALPDR